MQAIDRAADDEDNDIENQPGHPTDGQLRWLRRGLTQPGGKLPLFDGFGQKVSERTVRSCIRHGWAEPWFSNPIKPDWLVCRLTEHGRSAADAAGGSAED
ncbi:MAG: hypothetical protein O2944_06715 [Proteobacteria bacterium]|nr:hypothetical protein [Pseudomonadota bacterium]